MKSDSQAEAVSGETDDHSILLFAGDYPDPSIIRVGGDYYVTHSSFCYHPGLRIFHSTDLVNWVPITTAVNREGWDIWAPTWSATRVISTFIITRKIPGTDRSTTISSFTRPISMVRGPLPLH